MVHEDVLLCRISVGRVLGHGRAGRSELSGRHFPASGVHERRCGPGGGALYDKGWSVSGVTASEPTTDHALWATRPDTTSNTRTGIAGIFGATETAREVFRAREQCLVRWVLPRLTAEFEDAEAGYFRLRSFMSDADPSRRVRLDTATFEEANRRTSWRTWVEIHQALSSGTYREGPEHDSSELEQMGLIKKSVTLD